MDFPSATSLKKHLNSKACMKQRLLKPTSTSSTKVLLDKRLSQMFANADFYYQRDGNKY